MSWSKVRAILTFVWSKLSNQALTFDRDIYTTGTSKPVRQVILPDQFLIATVPDISADWVKHTLHELTF